MQLTLVEIGMMLDHRREMTKRDHHWPNAVVGSVIANANRDPEKRSDPFLPEDVMPHLAVPKQDMRLVKTPEEIRQLEALVMLEQSRAVFAKWGIEPVLGE